MIKVKTQSFYPKDYYIVKQGNNKSIWKAAQDDLEELYKYNVIDEYSPLEVRRLDNKPKKKSGRKNGQLDKLTPELEQDIRAYINDRSIKQNDLMRKHNISRNTLKKYVEFIKNETLKEYLNRKGLKMEAIQMSENGDWIPIEHFMCSTDISYDDGR